MTNPVPFTPADLPVVLLAAGGHGMYHWEIPSQKLAPNVIMCGDPNRARDIGERFLVEKRKWSHSHRGMYVVTGETMAGLHISVLGPGMGVGATEIATVELLSTAAFDLATRTPLPLEKRRQLTVIRVGTCGCIRPEFKLGRPIISHQLVGLDAAGIYYQRTESEAERALAQKVRKAISGAADRRWSHRDHFPVYASTTHPAVYKALHDAARVLGKECFTGHTVTADGFFAPQGRPVLGIDIAVRNLDAVLACADPEMANIEMEAAAINAILEPAGHRFGCICAAVAYRPTDRFATHEEIVEGVNHSIEIAMLAMEALN